MDGYGTQISAQAVESGSKATKPTDPKANGNTVGGWYKKTRRKAFASLRVFLCLGVAAFGNLNCVPFLRKLRGNAY